MSISTSVSTPTFTLQNAINLAKLKHEGQVDKAGEPYFNHLERVANYFDNHENSEEMKIIAYLHDIIEDTDITIGELQNLGCSIYIIISLIVLTHCEDETYEDYLLEIKEHNKATQIKLADLHDNMNPIRLAKLSEEIKNGLLFKYGKALQILGGK